MTEQEQIEALAREMNPFVMSGDPSIWGERQDEIRLEARNAHAAGYRKIPDEPTDEMVELSEDAIHNHLHQFIAASDPGDGTEHVLDDIPVGEVVDVVSAAVLDVLRGAS